MQDAVQLTKVAAGIYQVRLPLPFRLNHVNCYLLEDDGRWTIVDTGLNTSSAQRCWRQVWDELRISADAIDQVLVTHTHPDHVGLAGWLQQYVAEHGHQRRLPISMSAIELRSFDETWREGSTHRSAATEYFRASGLSLSDAERVAAETDHTAERTLPHPTDVGLLAAGDKISIGERRFDLRLASGHSPGMVLLYDAADELLICGDQLLMEITPNIGFWPAMTDEPLTSYLTSLRELRDLPVRLALPGHRKLIEDWAGRSDELVAHHEQRLAATLDAVPVSGATIAEVATTVFRLGSLNSHEVRFAIAETYSHLAYLVKAGELQQHDDTECLRFTPA